tara:strand:- start:963 stop:1727 length:765 start_codon:yes stop_codon:yes gene_type:complete
MGVKCDNLNLVYTPIDALSFKVSGDVKLLKPVEEDGVITALEGPNGLCISLGLTLDIKRIKYKVNIIKKVNHKTGMYYLISIAKRTKSSMFVLPMLGGNRHLYFWNSLFLNAFIATEEDTDCIALLYRWSSDTLFLKFEKALSKFRTFKRRYDPTRNCVMFVFNVPKSQRRNYNKFINGKYSKLSSTYKMHLLQFHNKDVDDTIGQVLFKTESRKKSLEAKLDAFLPEDSELLSILDIEDETYNPEIYKFKKLI